MYGFDLSGLFQQSAQQPVSAIGAYWGSPFHILNAECGWLYWVELSVMYGTDSMPSPSLTESLVIIDEGQRLYGAVNLISGIAGLQHPVGCTIKDSSGNVVFTHSQWVTVTYEANNIWVDFFENLSLAPGVYTVSWGVCGKTSSHNLTVHALPSYTTNDIDVNIIVTSTAGVNAYSVWDAIDTDVAAEMLVYNATVYLKSAEIKGDNLIIFHLEVTGPPEDVGSIGIVGYIPLAPIICWAIVAAIAFFLVGLPAIKDIKIAEYAYNISMQRYTYGDCTDMSYNEWVACMQSTYPDVWNNIKDIIVPPVPPPPPNGDDWMKYLMYIIIGVGVLGGIVIFIRYVLPALKGLKGTSTTDISWYK
jgi:hypothetical protein